MIRNSDRFAIEVASGSCFKVSYFPGVTRFLVGGHFGAVGGATVGLVMAYDFERKISKKFVK